ncbi:hypothetical protein BH11PSE13_BH11PSE13_27160 [soil metagenome]
MTTDDVICSLESIASNLQLADRGDDLVQSWLDAEVGSPAVACVLRFMDAHEDWDSLLPVRWFTSLSGSIAKATKVS